MWAILLFPVVALVSLGVLTIMSAAVKHTNWIGIILRISIGIALIAGGGWVFNTVLKQLT